VLVRPRRRSPYARAVTGILEIGPSRRLRAAGVGGSGTTGLWQPLPSSLPPPVAHHCRCDLFRIANWPRLHELMATLAGTALGVVGLIRTDAAPMILCLAC
jgi:hypothetical protein